MRKITARYPGTCRGCGGAIKAGARIGYGGRGVTYHDGCTPSGDPRADAEYQQGVAEANRYIQDKAFFGEALAERFELDAEMERYNRGED